MKKKRKIKKKLIILGASGHGKVILDMALLCGYDVLGFLDDDEAKEQNIGYPVLGRIEQSLDYRKTYPETIEFVMGIGSNQVRTKLDKQYNLTWATLIHPGAVVGRQVEIGAGTVVMANAVINSSAVIGRHCIINTGCIVEHDNEISDFVHISPGAILAGTVSVGAGSHIGAGATVKNNITIGEHITIGAGAVVTQNIDIPGVYVGVPARRL